MKSQLVDERIEREARRVAAAFGIAEWTAFKSDKDWGFNGVGCGSSLVSWEIELSTCRCLGSSVEPTEMPVSPRPFKPWQRSCHVIRDPEDADVWFCFPHPAFNECMARALYCLGFEDEKVIAELNYPLTAHEKLELRLSMPRELWPQQWLDEESAWQVEG